MHNKFHVATRNFFFHFSPYANGLVLFVLWNSLCISSLALEMGNFDSVNESCNLTLWLLLELVIVVEFWGSLSSSLELVHLTIFLVLPFLLVLILLDLVECVAQCLGVVGLTH